MKTPRLSPGFSLIELLVVIAIIGILAAVSLPALGSIQRAGSLNRGGQMISDAIVSARQEASGKNRNVELRVIQAGSPPAYRAFQVWIADDRGAMQPLGRVVPLPEGSLIAEETALSPLLGANASLSGTTNFGSLGSCSYAAIRLRAGGLPEAAITASNNFLTVRAATDTAVPPANYYTVRLDPSTGRVAIYRP
jgi:uncharacterized protein (TIGR02596 family)